MDAGGSTGLEPASKGQLSSARRLLRAKERARLGLFLVEGPQAVREALATRDCVRELFVTAAAAGRHAGLISAADALAVPVRLVGEEDLAALAGTVTPQGLVAVCCVTNRGLSDVFTESARLVVCSAQVRDPGNAGTVIRCADAFDADGVVLTEGSVEVHNPKTVRASAGSMFHLPIAADVGLADAVRAARDRGLQVLAADGAGEDDITALATSGRLGRPTLWLFGNEAWGMPAEHTDLADATVRVPIYGAAESLNLATAAAVCLYVSATAQRQA